jgi:hypothetical protein
MDILGFEVGITFKPGTHFNGVLREERVSAFLFQCSLCVPLRTPQRGIEMNL